MRENIESTGLILRENIEHRVNIERIRFRENIESTGLILSENIESTGLILRE